MKFEKNCFKEVYITYVRRGGGSGDEGCTNFFKKIHSP